MRARRFEATFSLRRDTTATAYGLWFVFNAKDQDHYDKLSINHNTTAQAPHGFEIVDGAAPASVSETRTDANMPTPGSGDVLWARVICDGSSVTVKCLVSANAPSENDWTNASACYTSSGFAFSGGGGMVGFMARNYNTWVDDLTVKTDRDNNGSYETTEAVETFTVEANGFVAETLAHDAAGNLTFDGVFQFTYDAWNRLVKVTKAYRDGNGDLQLGSVIQENAYDGMGRRVRRQVKNSADLDCTYHDYYTQSWQLIEQRNGSGQVLKQHVWAAGPSAYIDELVQNGLNDDPADQFEQDCETLHWAAQDANFNVLGIADASGGLVERYQYTAYGQRTVFFPAGSSDGPGYAPIPISRRANVGLADHPMPQTNSAAKACIMMN